MDASRNVNFEAIFDRCKRGYRDIILTYGRCGLTLLIESNLTKAVTFPIGRPRRRRTPADIHYSRDHCLGHFRSRAMGAKVTAHGGSDEFKVSLATMSPTPQQRTAALIIVGLLFMAFGVTAPFATVQLPQLNAFIPTLQAVISVTDLITAILLFAQFLIVGTGAILVLVAGYLFSALIVIPYALSFPGAFSPTGLFGGLQTTIWLYFFWHLGFPAAVLAYACLKDGSSAKHPATIWAPGWIVAIVISVIGVVSALTWASTQAERILPQLALIAIRGNALVPYAAASCSLMSAIAALLLWWRGKAILDLWVLVAICAGITEPLLGGVLSTTRFSLGFYASRGYSIVTSTIVLTVLLSEAAILYTRLSRAAALLQHERDSKLMNIEAVVASITHEVRQPLSAIATNGSAALLFLDRPQPDLEETRAALNEIVQDSLNASQIFDGIRNLFRGANQNARPVEVNAIVLGALHMLRGELKDHDVTVVTTLTAKLPPVSGHKGQLLEVVLNLLRNAIDAMKTVTERSRLLRIRTERHGRDAIVLSVEDSGPGIDPKKTDAIFDAFVTTKSKGMGLGLAISRMIVEHHGGRISVSSGPGKGARFQIVLPANSNPAA